jgi:hypothetical protein
MDKYTLPAGAATKSKNDADENVSRESLPSAKGKLRALPGRRQRWCHWASQYQGHLAGHKKWLA